MSLPSIGDVKQCICIDYPDCPHLGDIVIRTGIYKEKKVDFKNCKCEDEVLYCIQKPIRQGKERLKILKAMYRTAQTEDKYEAFIHNYKGSETAFIFEMKKDGKVTDKILLHRDDKDAIINA